MCLAYDREEDIRTVFKTKLFTFFLLQNMMTLALKGKDGISGKPGVKVC